MGSFFARCAVFSFLLHSHIGAGAVFRLYNIMRHFRSDFAGLVDCKPARKTPLYPQMRRLSPYVSHGTPPLYIVPQYAPKTRADTVRHCHSIDMISQISTKHHVFRYKSQYIRTNALRSYKNTKYCKIPIAKTQYM